MKMKIAALILVVLLPVLAVTATYATKVSPQTGTVTVTDRHMIGTSRTPGGNTIATFKVTFSLTGPLKGTAIAIERDVIHASSDRSFTTFQGNASFTSSGQAGTAVIHYVGVIHGTSIHGQFVVDRGTGSLAGFHGQGEFSGTFALGKPFDYTLRSHIAPEAKTKTTA